MSKRLIVCDDEAAICKLVRNVATPLGYEVLEVTRSTTFDDSFTAFAPDVVLLDVVMPDRDGIEIMQSLAAQGYQGKVILMSGYDPNYTRTARVLAECRGLTIAAVLQKPVPITRLREVLVA